MLLYLCCAVFAPAVESLVATPDVNLTTVNLTWTIPYTQVPPDGYALTYTAMKLSGVALARDDATTMVAFFDNETESFGSGGDLRLYTISDLLFYSQYQFELSAVYGSDNSTAEKVNVSMTAQGSEFIRTALRRVHPHTRSCMYMHTYTSATLFVIELRVRT